MSICPHYARGKARRLLIRLIYEIIATVVTIALGVLAIILVLDANRGMFR
jgi:hypothetical protein